jgi:hypothetical protein
MAESLNSAPRRAKTNFCELNLKIKNEFVFGGKEGENLEFSTLTPLLAIPC